MEFCQDVYRLFRINPYLKFSKWQQLSENRFHLEVSNSSTSPELLLNLDIQIIHTSDGLCIHYDQGIKSSTRLKIKSEDQGTSSLTIIDSYDRLNLDERKQRLNEVDKSLIKWAEDIQQYIVQWNRWSKVFLYRWYMKHVWQKMDPSARRISYMLIWITLVETSLIILGAAIYIIEY